MALPAPFRTSVDRDSPQFLQRAKENGRLCGQLAQRLAAYTVDEGPAADVQRHVARGQLTGRERLARLLDDGSPFLELCPFAGFGDKATPRNGVFGIGFVAGVQTMIAVDIPTLRGGSRNERGVAASLRCMHISIENRMPFVNLVQTGGADLTQQARVFHQGGETFRLLARRAALGLPTITVVFGSSTAGGAYLPGMSDYVVMVRGHAKVYLGGPPLVRMATGEDVGHEELGGATMHASVSGVSDYLATDEPNALHIAREIVDSLRPKFAACGFGNSGDVLEPFDEPLYPASDLLGIVSPSVREPFDMAEVAARIVDGSRLAFFKAEYGKTLVCAWARIAGTAVGIIANNGVLLSDAAMKGAQFVQLCNQKGVAILFFHNITGFMVGRQSEQGGLIKHGARLVDAVSNSRVPHISIIMGASFGAGNYAMCGRAYGPRFLFSYPQAKCSVMGAEQLSGVLDVVAQARLARQAGKLSPDEHAAATAMAAKQKAGLERLVERQMDAYYTSGAVLDDGIIDPRDTRFVLAACLAVVGKTVVSGPSHVGVSRL